MFLTTTYQERSKNSWIEKHKRMMKGGVENGKCKTENSWEQSMKLKKNFIKDRQI